MFGLIAAVTAAAYANTFSGPFVLDDEGAIVHNPSIHRLAPWGGGWGHPPAGTTVSGRPLLNASLALNYRLSGLAPWSYHALNLLIHVAAAGLLFGLVRRTLERLRQPHAMGIATTAALLWAVHPLQTEAVTYVVQRAESLMGMFYLLTLYAWIRGWHKTATASCLLGAMTKEVAATAPLMVLLFDRAFLSGSFREAWRARGRYLQGLAATWLVSGALVASTGGDRGGTSGFGAGVSWTAYWATQFKAVVTYLERSVWPHPLVFEYGTFWMPSVAAALPDAAVVLALLGWVVWELRRNRPAGFLGAWVFGILSVTSVVPGIYQMIVEHRMYLPLAAVVVGIAWLIWRRGAGFAWGMTAALGLACAALTFARNADYRSEVALWQATVDARPDNETAQTSLAIALFDAGRAADAVAHYQRAIGLRPDQPDTLNDLGCAWLALKQPQQAVVPLERAVRLQPNVPEYRFNYGTALAAGGRLEEAIANYREAIRLRPGHAPAHLKLALALWMTGRRDEAVQERQEGLRLQGAAAQGGN